jgi:gamma-glutamylcyclotransferase
MEMKFERNVPMSFYYFAYGSNMLTSRLEARCPSAKVICIATAKGYSLDFLKESKDSSGKATLVLSEGSNTQGVIFELTDTELSCLDRAEGPDYERNSSFVVHDDIGNEINTFTYLAKKQTTGLKPYDWYLALIIAGGLEHKINISHMREINYQIDYCDKRESRKDAVTVLSDSGYEDWKSFLGEPSVKE